MRLRTLTTLTLLMLAAPWSPALAASLKPTAAEALPPAEETAKDRLNTSPRHGEFVDVAYGEGKTPIRSYVVYPERKTKAGVVLVIHEIFGLSDWIRGVADQLAKEGFIAVAPDLISGLGPGGGGTDSTASRDDVVKLVRSLTPDEAEARLATVRDWASKLPASNARWATIGFCWGGARSFAAASMSPAPRAAVVYYGVAPDSAAILRTAAPVQGHYGGDDERVNATIAPAQAALKKLGRAYEPFVYDGAGHGFLRQQSGREGANQRATEKAWPRTIQFLKKNLE
jgi:carboxymethylenebutenolidase